MGLTHAAAVFVLLWVLLYASVYLFVILPKLQSHPNSENFHESIIQSRKISEAGNLGVKIGGSSGVKKTKITTNPFAPKICEALFNNKLNEYREGSTNYKTVGIVIPVRNEIKEDLMNTLESLIVNCKGNSILKQIVIVDDQSTEPVSDWKEWKFWEMQAVASNILKVVRLPTRLGVSGAKATGAKLLADKVDVLVFLDAHVIVSKGWLDPLVHSINKNNNAVVYPVIDVWDSDTNSLLAADNLIGGFDWSLSFRWEAPASDRTPLVSSTVSKDEEVTSPATPGMFAMSTAFYKDIGGLHPNLKYYGQDNIELSIRVWLCGGVIIRQPCSRVAHKYNNIQRDAAVGHGITQQMVDRNVMSVADQWMSVTQKETVFYARFYNRIPYKVEIALDARVPHFLDSAPLVSKDTCQSFDWYLKEVYPGLLSEQNYIAEMFQSYVSSNYMEQALQPLLVQYQKKTEIEMNQEVINALTTEEAKERSELSAKAAVLLNQGHNNNQQQQPPPAEKKVLTDPHSINEQMVKESLKCEDEKVNGPDTCLVKANAGECISNPAYMIFGCPKSCGLCGTDGLVCSDFYLKKCPMWKLEGQCETNQQYMAKECRASCGLCKLPETSKQLQVMKDQVNLVLAPIPPSEEAKVPRMNPYVTQQLLRVKLLLDSNGDDTCRLKRTDHGKLLDRVKLDRKKDIALQTTEQTPPRIFCAIYTTENNHKGNVQATRDTWAKRCTGFVAFSTVTDPEIPAVLVPHEGEESYNNMWQKSRSIWKYIAAHYLMEFDWFLLGGDDMFYIIENLRDYLNSPEIKEEQKKGKGMYVGRRFFPPKQQVFNSGGAGTILDRKALHVLVSNIDTPKCFPHQKGFWEDVNVANCLRVSDSNIVPYDTRDSLGRERFHPFTPGQHLTYRIPPKTPDWYANYNPELKIGYECCSEQSISFHYVPADFSRDLNGYIYHCDQKENNSI